MLATEGGFVAKRKPTACARRVSMGLTAACRVLQQRQGCAVDEGAASQVCANAIQEQLATCVRKNAQEVSPTLVADTACALPLGPAYVTMATLVPGARVNAQVALQLHVVTMVNARQRLVYARATPTARAGTSAARIALVVLRDLQEQAVSSRVHRLVEL